jgi:hypothetical protein
VPVAEMGRLLTKLVVQAHGKRRGVPSDIRTEAVIAERVLSDVAQVNRLGKQVPYNCPNCGEFSGKSILPVRSGIGATPAIRTPVPRC